MRETGRRNNYCVSELGEREGEEKYMRGERDGERDRKKKAKG